MQVIFLRQHVYDLITTGLWAWVQSHFPWCQEKEEKLLREPISKSD